MRVGLRAGAGAAVALALGLVASASASRGADPSSTSDAQQRLADVYARPPLDRLDRPPPHTPLDDLLSRIGDLFSRIPSSFPGALPLLLLVLVGLALLLLLITGIASAVLNFAVAGPLAGFGPSAYQAAVRTVIGAIVGVLVSPITLITSTLYYYDLRIRREAFDLEMLAESL